jgi:hypothetical protein
MKPQTIVSESVRLPRIDSTLVLTLARRHLDKGDMVSSARSCMAEAIAAQSMGNLDQACRRALRSIAYSVGILHSDYVRAFKASGIEGECRLVA